MKFKPLESHYPYSSSYICSVTQVFKYLESSDIRTPVAPVNFSALILLAYFAINYQFKRYLGNYMK